MSDDCSGKNGEQDSVRNEQLERIKTIFSWYRQLLRTVVKLSESSSHADRGIKLLQWVAWLLSRLCADSGTGGSINHWRNVWCSEFYKWYQQLAMSRCVPRLCYGMSEAIQDALVAPQEPDATRWTVLAAWMSALYYPLDHAAYIQKVMPRLLLRKYQQPEHPYRYHREAVPEESLLPNPSRLMQWACRCLSVCVVVDILSYWKQLQHLQKQQDERDTPQKSELDSNDSKNEASHLDPTAVKAMQQLRCKLLRSSLMLIPCFQYAQGQSWFSETVVNGLQLVEAVVHMYQTLRYDLQE